MPKRLTRIDAIATLTHEALPELPGQYRWQYAAGAPTEPAGILYACPCGCGAVHGIPFNGRGLVGGKNGWDWDGNKARPTITPSLGMYPKDGSAPDNSGYHWHGYLTAGIFKEC